MTRRTEEAEREAERIRSEAEAAVEICTPRPSRRSRPRGRRRGRIRPRPRRQGRPSSSRGSRRARDGGGGDRRPHPRARRPRAQAQGVARATRTLQAGRGATARLVRDRAANARRSERRAAQLLDVRKDRRRRGERAASRGRSRWRRPARARSAKVEAARARGWTGVRRRRRTEVVGRRGRRVEIEVVDGRRGRRRGVEPTKTTTNRRSTSTSCSLASGRRGRRRWRGRKRCWPPTPRRRGCRRGPDRGRGRGRAESRPKPEADRSRASATEDERHDPSAAPATTGSARRRTTRPCSSGATRITDAVEKQAVRKLKRVLADEQNEVLDRLRRNPKSSLDDLFPAVDEHAERYASAVRADLDRRGRSAAAPSTAPNRPKTDRRRPRRRARPGADARRCASGSTASLRDAAGDDEAMADGVRAAYREWKTHRVASQTRDTRARRVQPGSVRRHRARRPRCAGSSTTAGRRAPTPRTTRSPGWSCGASRSRPAIAIHRPTRVPVPPRAGALTRVPRRCAPATTCPAERRRAGANAAPAAGGSSSSSRRSRCSSSSRRCAASRPSTPTTSGSTRSARPACGAACSARRSASPSCSSALFFVLMWVNLLIADRIAPKFRPAGTGRGADRAVPRARRPPAGTRAHRRRRCCSRSSPARGASGEWNECLLFRNHVSFGIKDPQFDKDVGLLRLPAAVPELGRRLAVRRVRDRVHRHRGRALPERRHPGADAVPAGDAAGEGAPVGAARGARAGEGGAATTSSSSR